MAKVGTQLLLNARDRDRVRRLALVRGQLQAEMLRQLVEHALSVFETESVIELARLELQLERLEVPEERWEEAVRALLVSKTPVSALSGVDRFPLPL
jgi:Zn finger protein HypA/HybF involved in hydrogenase expression